MSDNREWYYCEDVMPYIGAECHICCDCIDGNGEQDMVYTIAVYSPFGWDTDIFNDYLEVNVIKWLPRRKK